VTPRQQVLATLEGKPVRERQEGVLFRDLWRGAVFERQNRWRRTNGCLVAPKVRTIII